MDHSEYDFLMAQMNSKRQLKEQYLRQIPEQETCPLTKKVIKNAILFSIREQVDIFASEPDFCGDPLETVMGWLESVAEVLGCGVYELFIQEETRDRAIVYRLLDQLSGFSDWNITGSGFMLEGFGFSPRANTTLVFQKGETGYTLVLRPNGGGFFPKSVLLWQETQGKLQNFIEKVLTPDPLAEELDTLKHLVLLLEEMPEANIVPILTKTAQSLEHIRNQWQESYAERKTRQGKAGILLLGGAIAQLEKLAQNPQNPTETLQEIIYMVESANDPM